MAQREEQIEQAAKDIARKWYHDPNNETAYIAARQGMLWADKHPKPNLVDIDKVCKWLEEHYQQYDEIGLDMYGQLITENLRKDMMEE